MYVWESVCARVFQGNHWATQANIHRHTWKLPCFYFCKFTACRKRMFSSSLSPRCMVERLRQPQGSQAESHWWTTTPRHPDPSIWPLSHFYYTRITISRSPTPPWDFATVFQQSVQPMLRNFHFSACIFNWVLSQWCGNDLFFALCSLDSSSESLTLIKTFPLISQRTPFFCALMVLIV